MKGHIMKNKYIALMMASAMALMPVNASAEITSLMVKDISVTELSEDTDTSQTETTTITAPEQGEKHSTVLNALGKSLVYRFSPKLFGRSSVYDHGLSKASFIMSLAAMDVGGNDDLDLQGFFRITGFDMDTYSSHRYDCEDTSDDAAVGICSMKLPDGRTLVAAAVRGGGYGGEWSSNMRVGNTEYHEGFMLSSTSVKTQIEEYIKEQGIDNAAIWLTGYSRGAAVAGLTGARLANEYGQENIYCYTFATPRAYRGSTSYKCIHNIINPADPVTYVPFDEWGYSRIGVDHYLDMSAFTDERAANVKKLYKAVTGEEPYHNAQLMSLPVLLSTVVTDFIPDTQNYTEGGYQDMLAELMQNADDMIANRSLSEEDMGEAGYMLAARMPVMSSLSFVALVGVLGEFDSDIMLHCAENHEPQLYLALLYAGGVVSEPPHTYTVRTTGDVSMFLTIDGGEVGYITPDEVIQPEVPAFTTVLTDNICIAPANAKIELEGTGDISYTVEERAAGYLVRSETFSVTLDGSRYTVKLGKEV